MIDRGALERSVISRIGTRAGFVTTIAGCEEAPSALAETTYSAVVIDFSLEGASCPNFLPLATAIGAHVPVVLMSWSEEMVRAGAAEVARLLDLKVVSVLLKPIVLPALYQVLWEIHSRLTIGLPIRPLPPPDQLRRDSQVILGNSTCR